MTGDDVDDWYIWGLVGGVWLDWTVMATPGGGELAHCIPSPDLTPYSINSLSYNAI